MSTHATGARLLIAPLWTRALSQLNRVIRGQGTDTSSSYLVAGRPSGSGGGRAGDRRLGTPPPAPGGQSIVSRPLCPGTPFIENWHLQLLAEHLEAVSAGETTRLLINCPPRSSKSNTRKARIRYLTNLARR